MNLSDIEGADFNSVLSAMDGEDEKESADVEETGETGSGGTGDDGEGIADNQEGTEEGVEGTEEGDEEEGDQEGTEGTEESSDDTENTEEDGKEFEKVLDYDETDKVAVKIKVGDEEYVVPVAEVQRLYGQEKALTQKQQAVAAKSQEAEQAYEAHMASVAILMKRAEERFKPYQEIDWNLAAKNYDEETYQQLRSDAQEAYRDVQYLQHDLKHVVDTMKQQGQAQIREGAKAALKEINDPSSPRHIPGWNDDHYAKIRGFATELGMAEKVVNQIVDPASLKIIDMAYRYQQGQTKARKVVKGATKKAKGKPISPRGSSGQAKKGPSKEFARVKREGGSLRDVLSLMD